MKSFEQISEEYIRNIDEKRNELLSRFHEVYISDQLNKLGDIAFEDICLVQQVGVIIDGAMITRYWFEHKPKFE